MSELNQDKIKKRIDDLKAKLAELLAQANVTSGMIAAYEEMLRDDAGELTDG